MVRTGPPEFYPTSEEVDAARQNLSAAPSLTGSNHQRAVEVRPHYPACEFPDYACDCGATEDRRAIVAALDAAEQRGAERVAQRMQELAEEPLRDALRTHHPIMRSETGPFSGCRCGQVRLGQDVIAHVVGELLAALADFAPPTAGQEGRDG